jgi:tRNA (guanine-N7-)-methyltransferase
MEMVLSLDSRELEVDIGSGLGSFTIKAAEENPDRIYVGIDINAASWHKAELLRKSRVICNAQFVHAEAMKYIASYISDASVSAFHLYFPTPRTTPLRESNILARELHGWLLTPAFMTELIRAARSGCVLRVATDHDAYFAYAAQLIEAFGLTAMEWTSPIRDTRFGYLVGTGCERRQRSLGLAIKYLQCVLG